MKECWLVGKNTETGKACLIPFEHIESFMNDIESKATILIRDGRELTIEGWDFYPSFDMAKAAMNRFSDLN
jgi:hypothetical protein